MRTCLTRGSKLTLFAAVALMTVGVASAQSGTRSGGAAQQYLNQINDANRAPTSTMIINRTIESTRAQAATTGIQNFQVQNSSVSSGGGLSRPSAANFGPGATVGQGKPFTNISRPPTVSPYLRLFDTNIGGGSSSVDNYNTLVRPRLEQQAFNQNLSRQTQAINRRVQQISAQPTFRPQGSDQIMATGHTTTFGYLSHYYPRRR